MTHKATWNSFSLNFFKKAFRFLLLHLSMRFYIMPSFRTLLLKGCGINFKNRKSVFIGTDVLFDIIKNTKTTIGENVVITTGTKIINHFPIVTKNGVTEYETGDVIIGDNVFIGSDTQLVAPVEIADGSTIGAGSTITKNTPENELTLSRSKQMTLKGWIRPVKNNKKENA